MKRSAELAFVALLAVSLAGKLAANAAPAGPDPQLFQAAAVAMVRAGGFDAASEQRKAISFVRGFAPDCRLVLGEWDPHGTDDQFYRELGGDVGPIRFSWRGRTYERAPKAAALAEFYLWRELRRVRIAAPRAPVAVWAASPGCDVGRLDWRRLASLPA